MSTVYTYNERTDVNPQTKYDVCEALALEIRDTLSDGDTPTHERVAATALMYTDHARELLFIATMDGSETHGSDTDPNMWGPSYASGIALARDLSQWGIPSMDFRTARVSDDLDSTVFECVTSPLVTRAGVTWTGKQLSDMLAADLVSPHHFPRLTGRSYDPTRHRLVPDPDDLPDFGVRRTVPEGKRVDALLRTVPMVDLARFDFLLTSTATGQPLVVLDVEKNLGSVTLTEKAVLRLTDALGHRMLYVKVDPLINRARITEYGRKRVHVRTGTYLSRVAGVAESWLRAR